MKYSYNSKKILHCLSNNYSSYQEVWCNSCFCKLVMLAQWIDMVTENETSIESQLISTPFTHQAVTSHKSQFSVELWDVAYATDETRPLVNSICKQAPKSLFWAPSCLPGFEYTSWLLEKPLFIWPISLMVNSKHSPSNSFWLCKASKIRILTLLRRHNQLLLDCVCDAGYGRWDIEFFCPYLPRRLDNTICRLKTKAANLLLAIVINFKTLC